MWSALRGFVASAVVVTMTGRAVHAQARPGNLGFESHDASGIAALWQSRGEGFQIVVDSASPFAGRVSLRTRWIDTARYVVEKGSYASGAQVFPVAAVAGRRLHLTGYVRTESVLTGYAALWMRVEGPGGKRLAFDAMEDRSVRGTTPWMRYDIELPVDSGAVGVLFGVVHSGNGTAWFDSVTVEAVGSAMPRTVESQPSPPPRPREDLTRLLTDAELSLPRDSAETKEDSATSAWVRANARPIRSLGASDFSDLRFFAPLLDGKRIVQLGESGHGVAEFSMAKVRLIKYLHEELGYDVLAFESSLFECNRANRYVGVLRPVDLMRSCLFSVWNVEEALPVFEYIKATHATNRPLILTGFDTQVSSPASAARPGVYRRVIEPIDSSYARTVHETDSVFLANANPAYASANQARLVAFYDSLAAFLAKNRSAIDAGNPTDPDLSVVVQRTARSTGILVRQLAAGPGRIGIELRDRAMADNLDFLLDEMHPGKKVIVWAHNFHIQHRENTPTNAPDQWPRTMGTWVAARHRPEVYTVGLFMYRGFARYNNGVTYPIAAMPSGGLESILHRAPWRYSFVDFSRATRTRGSEWMWATLTGMSWGRDPERFVPRDEYDGVLFIDMAHVPTYLR